MNMWPSSTSEMTREGPPVEFRMSAEQITSEMTKAGYWWRTQHDFLPRQVFLVYARQ